ncbi:MAG: glycerophosphodiester phosphodiesterase family protein [Microscillaceae bacterium]|nr:glycerophosphodiester phosphodiesterase family protein [Microscillaceae bacterium]
MLLVYGIGIYSLINAQDYQPDIHKLVHLQGSKPLITGHRGGFYAQLPENSLAAFNYTLQNACDLPVILELDIKVNRGGNLYVFHDDSLQRCSNGQGKIAEASDDYLKSLFLKNQSGEITSESIPTFDSVLSFAKNKNVVFMLDVKANIWEKVILAIKKHDMESQVIILTFKDEHSRLVYQLAPDCMISVLIPDEKAWKNVLTLGIPFENLIAYISSNTPLSLILEIEKNNIPLMTDVSEHKNKYTNPLPEDFYKELVQKNHLDILISDFPVEVAAIFCN